MAAAPSTKIEFEINDLSADVGGVQHFRSSQHTRNDASPYPIEVPLAFLATEKIRIGLLVDGKECARGFFDSQSGLKRLEESYLVLAGE